MSRLFLERECEHGNVSEPLTSAVFILVVEGAVSDQRCWSGLIAALGGGDQ